MKSKIVDHFKDSASQALSEAKTRLEYAILNSPKEIKDIEVWVHDFIMNNKSFRAKIVITLISENELTTIQTK